MLLYEELCPILKIRVKSFAGWWTLKPIHRPSHPHSQAAAEKNTPVVRHPAIDENGMPLPRRVEEIDMGATRVLHRLRLAHTPTRADAQASRAPG